MSEDEREVRAGETAGGRRNRGHPTGDAPRGIASSMYYGWSKEFLEAGKSRLAGDTARAATSDEVKDLRREAQALKEVVADLTLENRLLEKRMARPVCKGFDRERRKISLLQRIRPRRVSPGQDGDTRAPVLIKRSASSAAFLTRLPKRRSTVRSHGGWVCGQSSERVRSLAITSWRRPC
jgi:hypothetical protein